ncbi:MAG: sigma-70 family RNA polymerase sigma factor [Chloroflexi bacterium]|nr:sigma-70 family RNA polymerase sigma factor [Chloroflexota bacterium]
MEELHVVEALRRGDEASFASLVERYQTAMVRLALVYVGNQAVAEDVVQETWQGVVQGLDRFEGRCSLKTWIFRILGNCARTRAEREGRVVPFSSLWRAEAEPVEPSVDPSRFRATDPWRDHWTSFPRNWDELPEERLLSAETCAHVREAIASLSPVQQVITLRDVEGWTGPEVRDALGISEANQRVLLHRARSHVRRTLEQYLER